MRRNFTLIAISILAASCGGGGGGDHPTYTVSASVSGLQTGVTLVLANNGTNNTSVSANGTIGFSTALASGSAYAVTVATQPTGQTCTVASGSGTIGNANVNVAVTCASNSYTVGGTVTGLLSGNSVVLQNNAANDTTVSADGAFKFSTSVVSASPYAVTVLTQPKGQTCAVTNGSGTVGGANVTNVAVNCSANSYTVSIAVAGPPSVAGLVVQNNGGDNIPVSVGGTYAFKTSVASHQPYAVTIQTMPTGINNCFVTNGSGTVSDSNITVAVNCPWHTVYAANRDDTISAYFIDATTGTLNPVAGNPFAVPAGVRDLKIDPTGHFLYAVSTGTNSIAAFAIDAASGALTALAGTPFLTGANLRSMAIDPTGSFLYVADPFKQAYGFSINTTTGALTGIAGSPFTTVNPGASGPASIAVNPNGKFIYLGINGALSSKDQIVVAPINASTGALSPGTATDNQYNNASVTGLTVHPSGKYIYVTDFTFPGTGGNLRGYSTDSTTGALTEISGSPFSTSGARTVAISPDGKFAYVENVNGDAIAAYGINGTSGALTVIAGSPFATPGGAIANPVDGTPVVVDPSGTFACVAADQGIAIHKIDATTGALTVITGSPLAKGTSPLSIAIK